MAVVSVEEMLGSPSLSVGDKGSRSYTRRYRVIVSSKFDGPLTVSTAVDPSTGKRIPTYNEAYAFGTEADPGAFVNKIDPNREFSDDNPLSWIVTVGYSSKEGGEQQNQDPLLRPPLISVDFRTVRVSSNEAIVTQRNNSMTYGNMTNTVGELFVPAPQYDKSELIIRVTKNFTTFFVNPNNNAFNSINYQDFLGASAGCLRLTGLNLQDIFENGTTYVSTTWEFTYKPPQDPNSATIRDGFTKQIITTRPVPGWALLLIDRGFNEIRNGKRQKIRDVSGDPVREPALLNGQGQAFSTAGPLNNLNQYVLLYYQVYAYYTFQDFNLGV